MKVVYTEMGLPLDVSECQVVEHEASSADASAICRIWYKRCDEEGYVYAGEVSVTDCNGVVYQGGNGTYVDPGLLFGFINTLIAKKISKDQYELVKQAAQGALNKLPPVKV